MKKCSEKKLSRYGKLLIQMTFRPYFMDKHFLSIICNVGSSFLLDFPSRSQLYIALTLVWEPSLKTHPHTAFYLSLLKNPLMYELNPLEVLHSRLDFC